MSTAIKSKSRPVCLSMEDKKSGASGDGLESPPDSNGGFSSPLLDLKTTASGNMVSTGNQPNVLAANNTPSGSSDNSNSGEVYCICRRNANDENEDEDDVMIECESCKDWLHGRCVNLTQRVMADIEIYICPRCVTESKQTIYKKRKNFHRHDYSDSNAAKKPVQAGTPLFVEQLLQRTFLDAIEHDIIVDLNDATKLDMPFLNRNGFDKPILIRQKSGLGFTMPSAHEIDLSKIEDIVGGEYQLDVIDVQRQQTYRMNINELNTYFKTDPREDKVYNLISFEISKTKLTENITMPLVVKDISWVSNGVWPPDAAADADQASSKKAIPKPEVQKYCLISAARSYTDFHIDFGGSSVWYHVVKGSKIFYLIEPNDENLKAYEAWNTSKNHSEVFLGDKVKQCFKFEIETGNTILLPTGWIHAVYTPDDSLVFGGNFLHSFNIPLQIKIYDMEVRMKTPEKFRFPAFETLQWYAAKYYTQQLKELNSKRVCLTLKFFNCLRSLNNTLKKWINSKDYYQTHDYEIPPKINCDKLVKIMSKELSKAELLLKSNGTYKNPKNSQWDSSNMFTEPSAISETNVEAAGNVKKKVKEVLQFENMNDLEIKLDPIEPCGDEKLLQDNDSKPPLAVIEPLKEEKKETGGGGGGSLKLKLKVVKSAGDEMVVQVAMPSEITAQPGVSKKPSNTPKPVESIDDLIKKSDDEESSPEDDELIRDLKNSYQDNDYVYPSLKKSSVRAKQSTQENQENDSNQTTSRKRKLKPHAAQYLQPPKQSKQQQQSGAAQAAPVEAPSDEKSTDKSPKKTKKKNLLDEMIEKNLKSAATTPAPDSSAKSSQKKDVDDKDFELEDEPLDEEDDEDADFKLKCKNNLKLSKKIKKSQLKKVKEKEAKAKADDLPVQLASKASADQAKKSKKGFATTKQRLGKLLKLNRCVNI